MASAGLRRAGTQVRASSHHHKTPSPPGADEEFPEGSTGHEDDSYFARQASNQSPQYPTSPINRSPWSTPSNEWRPSGGNANLIGSNNGNSAIDEAQRALSSLDINSQAQGYSVSAFSGAQSSHPPRFNPNQSQQAQQLAPLGTGAQNDSDSNSSLKLQLITADLGERSAQLAGTSSGPASASAYVPPIGHGLPQSTSQQQRGGASDHEDRANTAAGTWDQKERVLQSRSSNPNMNYGSVAQQQAKAQGIPSVPPIPAQFLNQQQSFRLGLNTTQVGGLGALGAQPGLLTSPVDIPALVATKGYNPQNFDTRPTFVRGLRNLSPGLFTNLFL
jgi:YTH domain-containing family protein